jgi:capsular polysaccharide biosynthesis protein
MAERDAYRKTPLSELLPTIDQAGFEAGEEGSLVALDGGSVVLGRVEAGTSVAGTDGVGRFSRIPRADMVIQRPVGMPDQGSGFLQACRFPDMTVSRLRSAICMPGGVLLRGDKILVESFSAPWEAHEHRHLTERGGAWRVGSDRDPSAGDLTFIDGPVLWLDNQHLDWFGHFMLDLLTRAWAFEFCRSFLRMRQLKVICSRPVPNFGLQLFMAAGIGPEDLLLFDRPVACLDLIVATKAFQIQEYTSPPAIRLWEIMYRRAGFSSRPNARIYVSRRANPTRSLVEEADVEQVFRKRGFLVIYPETMRIREQIDLFVRASLLAGCSGSNMFNLAYARRAKAAFILVSPLLIHYQEHFLAAGSDLAIEYFVGRVDPDEPAVRPGDVHADWHVDAGVLAARVDEWLSETREPAFA